MTTSSSATEYNTNLEHYYSYFEGILTEMLRLMAGENPDQTPRQALETACGNQASVLANYQEKLAVLEPRIDGSDALATAMVREFESLNRILTEIKDRPEQVPLNPVLCALLMSTAFAQSRALRELFKKLGKK